MYRLLLAFLLSCSLAACDSRGPGPANADAQLLAGRAGQVARLASGVDAETFTRKRALAEQPASAVSDTAAQLFEFGESAFAVYFPSRRPTLTVGGMVYRHYPETGAFLIVDEALRVYVLGGPFGSQVILVGVATELLAARCLSVVAGFDLGRLNESPGGGGNPDDPRNLGTGSGGSEGAIRGADVRLYDPAGRLLGSAVSDDKGLVTLRACGATGPFMVEYLGNAGAQYFDEGIAARTNSEANAWVPLPAGIRLSAWVESLSSHHIAVTPLTHLAAQGLAFGATAAAVRAANERVRTLFNLQFAGSGLAIDDITKMPALAHSLESLRSFGNDPRGRYAQVLAALAKSAAQFNPALTNPAREMTQQLLADLGDGVLDGKDSAGAAVAPTARRAYDAEQLQATLVQQAAGRLTTASVGEGSVTVVSSSQAAVSCGTGTTGGSGVCYPFATTVTLAAQAAPGWTFQGWSGACGGTANCQATMSGDKSVTATFTTSGLALTIVKAGAGAGTVTSTPSAINCGTVCAAAFPRNSLVTLTASPAAGSIFVNWSEQACGASSSCALTLGAARSVTATFAEAPPGRNLIVTVVGTGAVTSSATSGVASCSAGTCTTPYPQGTAVSLLAVAGPGMNFAGWSGDCSGTGSCEVAMSAERRVTATFAAVPYTLGGTVSGLGVNGLRLGNAGQVVSVSAGASEFTFGPVLIAGRSYAVSVVTQPTGLTCVVSSGRGVAPNGPVSSLAVACAPSPASLWTWFGGSNLVGGGGVYGTKGVASTSNIPGGRALAATWRDAAGRLWLFGGLNGGLRNDLWRFDPVTRAWTWVGGSNTPQAAGVYGTQGEAASGNTPGARWRASSWVDATGQLWLFGGQGFDAQGATGLLNDLWRYNPGTGLWTWVKGSQLVNGAGLWGVLGAASESNAPSARESAVAWLDASGNLWLFGGSGFTVNGVTDLLGDLWKFSPTSRQWAWTGGVNTTGATAVYGSRGVPSSGSRPGGRWNALGWTDAVGHFWLFGGDGYASQSVGLLNDLWRHDPVTGAWAWISGASVNDAQGVYGTQGVASTDGVPGARHYAAGWIDDAGGLWLLGGAVGSSNFNDLWRYTLNDGLWTWVGGTRQSNAPGLYGSRGVASTQNMPGGINYHMMWFEPSSGVWLFGGSGYDQNGSYGSLNGLWRFGPP